MGVESVRKKDQEGSWRTFIMTHKSRQILMCLHPREPQGKILAQPRQGAGRVRGMVTARDRERQGDSRQAEA
jgi:hypothetical protein